MKRDLTGQRFGRLKVVGVDIERSSTHDIYWICKCDCGAEKTVTTGHLTSGTVRSCGCLRREQSIARFRKAAKGHIRHGEAGTKLYYVWNCMRQRCENPKNKAYRWYGGKGIRVCKEWQDYGKFAEWAYANGYQDINAEQWNQKLSIDRIDSDGDYCPENCRWITIHENSIRATETRREKARRSNGSAGTKDVA